MDQQTKQYNLSAIHDLQSRLMLLGSGEKSSDIEMQDEIQFEKDFFIQVY